MTNDPHSGEAAPFGASDEPTTVHPTEPSPWAPGGATGGVRGAAMPPASSVTEPAMPAHPANDPFDRPAAPPPMPIERPVVRSRGSGMLVNVLLGIALIVAVGGVAFAAGRATAPTTTATGRNGFGANGQGGFVLPGGPTASGAPGGGFNGGFGGGGISIQGTVTAVAADSITVQLASGQSVTIPTNADTTYHSQAAATAADVTSGSTVRIQLQGGGRGAFGNGNGGQGGGPNGSGAPGRTLGAATSITLVPAGS